MSSFDYLATRPNGTETTGRIDAADAEEARRLLTAQGLTVRNLTLVADSAGSETRRPLSAAQSEQLAGHVAQLGATGLPLEAGLRAAAAELQNTCVAAALNDLSTRISQGASLESAIAEPGCQLPPHVGGLIAVASRTGRLGAALSELLVHQHGARSLRREVASGFAYPLFVMGVTLAVVFLILYGLTGVFQEMFIDFELDLPGMTLLLFWWRDVGIFVLMASVVFALALAAITRAAIGPAAWFRAISTLPVVGRVSYWSGMAEWTGLMSVLVHHDVPMPEALRLTVDGVRNSYVGDIAASLATATEGGKSFSDALAENRQVPASLVPVIRWGERVGSLAEALSTTRELLERRVRVRALMLRAVVPPVLFILLFGIVGGMVVALFMPLINLIQGLS